MVVKQNPDISCTETDNRSSDTHRQAPPADVHIRSMFVTLHVVALLASRSPAHDPTVQLCKPLPPKSRTHSFDCTPQQRAKVLLNASAAPCMCNAGAPDGKGCIARADPYDPWSAKWRSDGLMRSQALEDKYVLRNFFHPVHGQQRTLDGHGFFIELGAYDGVTFSNSHYFEHGLRWRGVLIEAEPQNYARLRSADRPRSSKLHAAVCANASLLSMAGRGGIARAAKVRGGLKTGSALDLGGLDSGLVNCLPMNHLLELSGAASDASIVGVDLFSIDVEGAEIHVLNTHDWRRFPARVLLIEDTRGQEDRTRRAVHHALSTEGRMCRFARGVGMRNEVWVDPEYEAHSREAAAIVRGAR